MGKDGPLQSDSGFIRREREAGTGHSVLGRTPTNGRLSSLAARRGQATGQKVDEQQRAPGSFRTHEEVLGGPPQACARTGLASYGRGLAADEHLRTQIANRAARR